MDKKDRILAKRQTTTADMTAEDVLRELIADVKAVGSRYVAEDWPDLFETYRHAKAVLANKPRRRKAK